MLGVVAMILAITTAGALWVARGAWRSRGLRRERDRALRAFREASQTLGETLREAADRVGKPRGLRWVGCALTPQGTLFARDAATGVLYALAPVDVSFAAVAGGDMEGVAAVGDVRRGTAVFVWREARWTTDGRVVFNLDPAETRSRHAASLVDA